MQKKYWSPKKAETPALGLGDPSGKKSLQDFILLLRSTHTLAQNFQKAAAALIDLCGSGLPIWLQLSYCCIARLSLAYWFQKEIESQDNWLISGVDMKGFMCVIIT